MINANEMRESERLAWERLAAAYRLKHESTSAETTDSTAELRGENKDLRAENERLRHEIACACNALTDSILVSGNDLKTNLHWVKRLAQVTKTYNVKLPEQPK